MLHVQEYLKTNTIESLEAIGVFAKYHPTLPYAILDYDMVESSKFKEDPIVRECRGLCIRTDDYSIIHKAFNRFFNISESSCTDKFNWESFSTESKEDGSLIKCRWYDKDLFITTRNSFAESHCGDSGKSWKELVVSCLTPDQKSMIQIHNTYTFVFELCTEFNIVVVHHPKPKLVLLSIFYYYGNELNSSDIDNWNVNFNVYFNRPKVYKFESLNQVQKYLDRMAEEKDNAEGFVLKDSNGVRLKIKNSWYLQLHRLSGNGNIIMTKNLLPLLLAGEKDEILSYFSYLEPKFLELELIVAAFFMDLHDVWKNAKDIEDQKEFAIYITKQNNTPFSSILFHLKKDGKIQDEAALKHKFNESSALILKVLEG
jgi:hypothetical protein